MKHKKNLNKLVIKRKIEFVRWKPECNRREMGTYVAAGKMNSSNRKVWT